MLSCYKLGRATFLFLSWYWFPIVQFYQFLDNITFCSVVCSKPFLLFSECGSIWLLLLFPESNFPTQTFQIKITLPSYTSSSSSLNLSPNPSPEPYPNSIPNPSLYPNLLPSPNTSSNPSPDPIPNPSPDPSPEISSICFFWVIY